MSGGNINNHRAHPTFACISLMFMYTGMLVHACVCVWERVLTLCIGSKRLVGPKAGMVCTHKAVLAWQAQTVLTLQGLGSPGRPCTHRQKLWRERRTCEPVGQVLPKLAKACVSSRTSEHTHPHKHTCSPVNSLHGFATREDFWKISELYPGDLAHLRQFCTQTIVKLMHTYTQTETPGF